MAQDIVTVDLGFVNAYLVKIGQGFVLADTGMASQWGKLSAALASAGCEPGLLKLVVLTHADMDHVGMRDASSPNGRSPSRSMPRTPPPSRRARRPSGRGGDPSRRR